MTRRAATASAGVAADGRCADPDLSHVACWIFDLDNTLYPAECRLFAEIDARMRAFIERRLGLAPDAARRVQKEFYVRYGTTMAGLMAEHAVEPEDFLAYVHDIDLSPLADSPALAAALRRLPGKRYIFTNGSRKHAENVTARLGVDGLFDDVFDIRAAGWTPKPRRETYEKFLAAHGVDPTRAAMFEDLAHNLVAPFELGMTTVLVTSRAAWIADEPAEKRPAAPGDLHDHVHHATDDLAAFLAAARVLDA